MPIRKPNAPLWVVNATQRTLVGRVFNPTHPKAGDDEVNGGEGGVGGGDYDGGDDGDGGVAMMFMVAVRVVGVRIGSAGGGRKLAGGGRI
ncbi:hypothetical protein Tco_1051077 [Tanacetum coccineum]